MRLLQLLPSLNPVHGGPVEAVRLLTHAHLDDDHDVEVACLTAPTEPHIDLPVPMHWLGPARGKYAYTPHLVPWLRANHARFHAVIVNGLWQYQGLATRRALHGTPTPYFVFPHGMLDPWFKQQYPGKHLRKWLYWPWGEYRVLRDAAAVLFTCEEEKLLAPQSFWLYQANSRVTGLGTRPPQFDRASTTAAWHAEYPHLQGKRVLLFMGRIHPKKGCDLLVEAFATVFAAHPEWHLLMVGPDQVNWKLQLRQIAKDRGIADRITWAGPRMGGSRWGALALAEAFVLPSHQENFGIAVAEALACGKPVLLSDKVNIWREIQQENAGLVRPDTPDGTTDLLRAWAAVPLSDHAGFHQRAEFCFQRHFDIRVCAKAVIAAVEAAAASRGIARG